MIVKPDTRIDVVTVKGIQNNEAEVLLGAKEEGWRRLFAWFKIYNIYVIRFRFLSLWVDKRGLYPNIH